MALSMKSVRGGKDVKGKRVRTIRYNARHLATGRKRAGRSNTGAAEDAAILKLVICGVIFVLVVAVKLLFPENVDRIARSVSLLIGKNADFVEAFAAMGRAAGGDTPVGESLQDAYAAVFHPSPMGAEVTRDEETDRAETWETELLTYTSAPRDDTEIQWRELTVSGGVSAGSDAGEQDFMIPALPENASLEHRNFGFSHTSPVLGTLTSSFGWREHPVDGETRFHYGIDLAADTGTEIRAFAEGSVYATGESSTLGKYIILSHDHGYKTLYAHCSAITKLSGKVVEGECIAKVGETGTATGPHLHFEIHFGSLYLNPIYYVDLG